MKLCVLAYEDGSNGFVNPLMDMEADMRAEAPAGAQLAAWVFQKGFEVDEDGLELVEEGAT